jgi:uncharacterized RDD family membrane protein YckC
MAKIEEESLSSLRDRFWAIVVDFLVFLPPSIALDFGELFSGFDLAPVFWVGYFVYYIALEARYGGTIGKIAMGLRVVGQDGAKIDLRQSTIRNLLRAIDWLPLLYILGYLVANETNERQRIGDLVAHTVVVEVEADVVAD